MFYEPVEKDEKPYFDNYSWMNSVKQARMKLSMLC
jgi:hypothetical protein